MADEKPKKPSMFDDMMGDFSLDLDMESATMDDAPLEVRDAAELGLNVAREMIPNPTAAPEPDEDVSIEKGLQDSVNLTMSHIQSQAAKAQATSKANISTAYFLTIVFMDTRQARAFADNSGWAKFGNPDIDGVALAQHLGIEIPKSDYAPRDLRADKKLADLSFDPSDPLFE